jgi:hypothetical protein
MRIRKGKLRDRKDDFHRTPVQAVQALMRLEKLPPVIWEPACGDGAIVEPLREGGHIVVATDLVDRGCPISESGVDFLLFNCTRPAAAIVTNPPYKLAQSFVTRAVDIAPLVCMLLPLGFLAGQERMRWHYRMPLARVWVSSRRLPMMHRDGWLGPIATSTVDHAWFVWDQAWHESPVIGWFDWA